MVWCTKPKTWDTARQMVRLRPFCPHTWW
jgi:hypothetical protein